MSHKFVKSIVLLSGVLAVTLGCPYRLVMISKGACTGNSVMTPMDDLSLSFAADCELTFNGCIEKSDPNLGVMSVDHLLFKNGNPVDTHSKGNCAICSMSRGQICASDLGSSVRIEAMNAGDKFEYRMQVAHDVGMSCLEFAFKVESA